MYSSESIGHDRSQSHNMTYHKARVMRSVTGGEGSPVTKATGPDTSLIYPPTYSGQEFPQQTQKWRFYPRGLPFYYWICQFTYKPIKIFPYKKSAEVSPKDFRCLFLSPPSHQLATPRGP